MSHTNLKELVKAVSEEGYRADIKGSGSGPAILKVRSVDDEPLTSLDYQQVVGILDTYAPNTWTDHGVGNVLYIDKASSYQFEIR